MAAGLGVNGIVGFLCSLGISVIAAARGPYFCPSGGTLTVAQANDPGYLALNAIGTDTYNATHHIFDSLLRYDDNRRDEAGAIAHLLGDDSA